MPDLYSSKLKAYDELKSSNFPYLDDYNDINPPPQNEAKADQIEYRYQQYILSAKGCFAIGIVGALCAIGVATAPKTFPNAFWGLVTVDGFLYLCIVLAVVFLPASLIFYRKADKATLQQAIDLRKPINPHFLTNTDILTCKGTKFHVTTTYESSTPFHNPFTSALKLKLFNTTKQFFDEYDMQHRGEPEADFRNDILILQDNLEGRFFPRVCEICHDFQPKLFRYEVTVTVDQTRPDGINI